MKILTASRQIWADSSGKLRLKFDVGRFTIESDEGKGPVRSLEIDAKAMDRLVLEWPKFLEFAAETPPDLAEMDENRLDRSRK